jgi:hypothetical protein
MVTIRMRYENGHLIPLDPLPEVEEGDVLEVQWQGKANGMASEGFLMMLASERRLSRIWDTPEEDEAWKDL